MHPTYGLSQAKHGKNMHFPLNHFEKTLGRSLASTIDPETHADRFKANFTEQGMPTYRRWQASWLHWKNGYYNELSDEEFRAVLVRQIKTYCSKITTSIVNNAIMHLQSMLALPSDLEPNYWIGNPRFALNGDVVCLKDSLVELNALHDESHRPLPATPEYFNLVATDYEFVSRQKAGKPIRWIEFLDSSFDGHRDSIRTLQQWFGYCLTWRTDQQKILFVTGPKRSGKGTIARVLQELLGERNVCGPTMASLAKNFGLESWIGKKLAVVSDARLSTKTASEEIVERLLTISGQDTLSIDRKFKAAWTGKLQTRIMILSNETPRLNDASTALSSRMLILRTPKSFYGKEDHSLQQELRKELPAIFHWAVDGWHDLDESKRFFIPATHYSEINEMERLSSPMKAFLDDCCIVTGNADDQIQKDKAYAVYELWCDEEGTKHKKAKNVFFRDLKSASDHQIQSVEKRDGDTRVYSIKGVKKNPECDLWASKLAIQY